MIVGIVGLGYVGLPLAVAFAEEGNSVIGVDVDPRRIAELRAGRSHVEDIGDERYQAAGALITPTTRFEEMRTAEAILICVPTPLTPNREPDLGPLLSAGGAVGRVLQRGQTVVLESTTYPGTTRERLLPLLEESGLVAGRDFHLAFSPERVDPGNERFTIRNTPKVVGGIDAASTEAAAAIYERICERVVRVATPEVAELSKLLENIFRSVNIALVNELAILCHRMGIDVWEVIDAAATKPFGFMRFEPGPGMGGHCLPVDPFYLTWKAREYDLSTEFIELAGKINQYMPRFCVDRITDVLNDAAKPVRESRILVLGVSYKPGVGDLRESPAIRIMERLRERGAVLSYHDPYVADLPAFGLRSSPLPEALDDVDLGVLVTAHPGVNHAGLADTLPLLLDLRGKVRDSERGAVTTL